VPTSCCFSLLPGIPRANTPDVTRKGVKNYQRVCPAPALFAGRVRRGTARPSSSLCLPVAAACRFLSAAADSCSAGLQEHTRTGTRGRRGATCSVCITAWSFARAVAVCAERRSFCAGIRFRPHALGVHWRWSWMDSNDVKMRLSGAAAAVSIRYSATLVRTGMSW
jgi:hypothetical protein